MWRPDLANWSWPRRARHRPPPPPGSGGTPWSRCPRAVGVPTDRSRRRRLAPPADDGNRAGAQTLISTSRSSARSREQLDQSRSRVLAEQRRDRDPQNPLAIGCGAHLATRLVLETEQLDGPRGQTKATRREAEPLARPTEQLVAEFLAQASATWPDTAASRHPELGRSRPGAAVTGDGSERAELRRRHQHRNLTIH